MAQSTPILPEQPTVSDCVKAARHLYQDARPLPRLLMTYRPTICPFEELLQLVPQGSSVLDVGCGGGLMLSLLAASGRIDAGRGFDTNGAMIQLASRVSEAHQLPLQFEQRSVAEGIPEGTFDVISIIDVMHHIPSNAQAGFFEDVVARLPPGGTLIYKDMCSRPIWRAAANRLHDLALARQWIHYCPVDRVRQWASSLGLTLRKEQNHKRLWYGHELLVLTRPDG